ncbi:TetR family transcriptional regulator [Microbispora rosea subsp. aerata]|nr:TetR family transcriptional regulator [Microbispora rosea]GGO20689.1 TetR family transcriptional regulator [Microbispora rosea subsp. aerata]GIH57104.1 TetR family transcriptional regulator [Microbispora rosea subsp. aerata]GLJ84826.1 TetR family transcriptional regulator [Microbispora rosea subsp. aerata]
MATPSISRRLAEAAVTLFDENGYEETTVDDIAARAGVSRSTFFRYYRSKEDAIFPDHDALLAQVDARLRASTSDTALVAVSDAVRIVLAHYVENAEVSLRRYSLVRRVPALRDREIASVARYQRLFREFIGKWLAGTPDADLRAELMAASVVAAHNQVLRGWLRAGGAYDPLGPLDRALGYVIAAFRHLERPEDGGDGQVLVATFSSSATPEAVMDAIRAQLGPAVTRKPR